MKLHLLQQLLDVNQAFESVVRGLERMEKLRLFNQQDLRYTRAEIESARADTNRESEPSAYESYMRSPNNAAHTAATGGDARHDGHLLTVREVADLLQVPVSWVYGRMRKRSSGRLPGYRLGQYWRFNEAEVIAWLASQRANA